MPKPNQRVPRSYHAPCQVVVIWIDWYAYHHARFDGLQSAFGRNGEAVGIELVGGAGVHAGFHFRESVQERNWVDTLLPDIDWANASKFGLALAVWKKLSKLQPEAVLVPGYYTLPALAAAMWAKLHKRVSILMTESTAEDHLRISWKEKIKSILIRTLFDSAVCGGAAHLRYLLHLRFPADRIARFYDVVDNARLNERSTFIRSTYSSFSYGLPASYFLFVGRLAPEKNVRGLLNAWLRYRESGGTWSLVLAGDGPDASALREVAAATPWSSDVHFAGHKSSSELLPFYSFAGCFVLPSTREPWGLVVNEAMACSLPVIVSNHCGCAEDLVQQGVNGFTFDPQNFMALTKSLHAIAEMPPTNREGMGKASAMRILAFSPQRFGHEIKRLASSTARTTFERRDTTSSVQADRTI